MVVSQAKNNQYHHVLHHSLPQKHTHLNERNFLRYSKFLAKLSRTEFHKKQACSNLFTVSSDCIVFTFHTYLSIFTSPFLQAFGFRHFLRIFSTSFSFPPHLFFIIFPSNNTLHLTSLEVICPKLLPCFNDVGFNC